MKSPRVSHDCTIWSHCRCTRIKSELFHLSWYPWKIWQNSRFVRIHLSIDLFNVSFTFRAALMIFIDNWHKCIYRSFNDTNKLKGDSRPSCQNFGSFLQSKWLAENFNRLPQQRKLLCQSRLQRWEIICLFLNSIDNDNESAVFNRLSGLLTSTQITQSHSSIEMKWRSNNIFVHFSFSQESISIIELKMSNLLTFVESIECPSCSICVAQSEYMGWNRWCKSAFAKYVFYLRLQMCG